MAHPQLVVVGGGYTGVLTAIHFARQSQRPLDITIVEPQAELGRGVAYAAKDPDHRLNAPTGIHILYPDDPDHFTRWHDESGTQAADPNSTAGGGGAYSRRWDFGTYLAEQMAKVAAENPSRSKIEHYRSTVRNIRDADGRLSVLLADGGHIVADLVLVATSNAPPAIPTPLRGIPIDHPGFVANPWSLEKLANAPTEPEVFILGTGLTMADIVATLTRQRPNARITAVSRRGLLPTSRPPIAAAKSAVDTLGRAIPEFVERHGTPTSARAILRLLRENAERYQAQGGYWQTAFDEVRDAAHLLWPSLSAAEQARFVRHLWPWYEVHRFRLPPPTEDRLHAALAADRLTVQAAKLTGTRIVDGKIEVTYKPRGQENAISGCFDALINCTGPERKPRETGDPLLKNLAEGGMVVAHSLGLGIEVDELCRARNENGEYSRQLRFVGPLTRGRFGEANGVPHIVSTFIRAFPDMLSLLADDA